MSKYTDRLDNLNTIKGISQSGVVTPLAIVHNRCVYNNDTHKPAFIALENMDRNAPRDFDLANAFAHRETSGNTSETPSIKLEVQVWKDTARKLGKGYQKDGKVSPELSHEVHKHIMENSVDGQSKDVSSQFIENRKSRDR